MSNYQEVKVKIDSWAESIEKEHDRGDIQRNVIGFGIFTTLGELTLQIALLNDRIDHEEERRR